MNRVNTMTIERKRRDRHPARSARILSTGIALSATFGLTTAYALAARAQQPQDPAIVPPQDPASGALPSLATTATIANSPQPPATATVVAPSAPAPAAPVSAAASDQSGATVATAPPTTAAPVITIPVQVALPVWTPPKTSGSN